MEPFAEHLKIIKATFGEGMAKLFGDEIEETNVQLGRVLRQFLEYVQTGQWTPAETEAANSELVGNLDQIGQKLRDAKAITSAASPASKWPVPAPPRSASGCLCRQEIGRHCLVHRRQISPPWS